MSTERIIVKLMKYNPNPTSKEVLHQLIKRIINPSYSIDNNTTDAINFGLKV